MGVSDVCMRQRRAGVVTGVDTNSEAHVSTHQLQPLRLRRAGLSADVNCGLCDVVAEGGGVEVRRCHVGAGDGEEA